VLAIALLGPAVLVTLRRAARRAAFTAPVTFTAPAPFTPVKPRTESSGVVPESSGTASL
jgi:energy-coupling factor transport system substrate-specific component